ncbi:MAG: cob(I)yrinic acid a,c-diamide adenosyltransferase [Deferribacteraceae bacterium]|jgi:cob(I)alamin adenosyltransferase|nr:cob(I)yrinic acid a,c-diamide adenosyltransferase [Deferribacteraceae bacterium]
MDRGYIQVYTGSGKGKTTAAIGVSMRAIATGMSVYFGQFLKLGESAEHKIFNDYSELITYKQFGSGVFVMGDPGVIDYEKAACGWHASLEAINSNLYDLVVLDELNLAINLNLIPVEDVVNAISKKPSKLEVIITGRYATDEIIAAADLVTEMKEVKHYYKKGVPARKGIEY